MEQLRHSQPDQDIKACRPSRFNTQSQSDVLTHLEGGEQEEGGVPDELHLGQAVPLVAQQPVGRPPLAYQVLQEGQHLRVR